MAAVMPIPGQNRVLMSGSEAVARGLWESGARVVVAAAGLPSSGILDQVSVYPELHVEWSANEKASFDVAMAAACAGSRAMCVISARPAMRHLSPDAASDDPITLSGVLGGMVIVVADDLDPSSSQITQDSRRWGRLAHLPILEPADVQEVCEMTRAAFDLSEEFATPVLLRLTTQICSVRALITVGEQVAHSATSQKYSMIPTVSPRGAGMPLIFARERELSNYSDQTSLNILERGRGDKDSRRLGFITSGPATLHVRECFPDAPVLKMGMSYPLPMNKIRGLIEMCENVVVIEDVDPLVEAEIMAEGFKVLGKSILPQIGAHAPIELKLAIARFLGDPLAV